MVNALIFATLLKNRMAILTKIRNRSGIAIGFVGLALVLFLVSDALSSGNSIFNAQSTNVGSVDGDGISYKQLELEIAKQEENYKERNQGQPIDDNTKNQIREKLESKFLELIEVETYKKVA
jgi:peptidyl-prolyl cis-trans isomerase D